MVIVTQLSNLSCYFITQDKTYIFCISITVPMSRDNVYQKLKKASEITLSVKGRKTRKQIPRPAWFSFEDNTLYLLPVEGIRYSMVIKMC